MKLWLIYVLGAGLCWGTYVPLIQYGGRQLGNNRYGAFLCVGLAYFLIAVLFPLALFLFGEKTPDWKATGITFATLAGVAGALGALCVIFAAAAALPEDRLYIAPLIFTLAPILNTLVSLIWHPAADAPWVFGWPKDPPGWKLYVGILLAAIGAGLVLYSKEEAESQHPAKPQTVVTQAGQS